jgi:hypothetical protein
MADTKIDLPEDVDDAKEVLEDEGFLSRVQSSRKTHKS